MKESVFKEEATTTRTLRNIRSTIKKTLKKKHGLEGSELNEKVEDLLDIHGLGKENFDFICKADSIINGRLNDESIDDNSNKNEKSVMGIVNETSSPVSKALGYDYLYRTMVEEYGKKEAKRLSGEMYDFSLAIADSGKILLPYCWAFNASKLVLEGRPFCQLKSAPPRRIASYISALNETVHQMSSHLAGAIAISSFFFDIAHLAMFHEKFSMRDLKRNKKARKYIENSYQNFIHSVNHLSRNGNESPFTNVSVFDRVKIRKMLEELNWYFDSSVFGGTKKNKVKTEYLVEYIMQVQQIYVDFFDKGDPLQDGLQYRFPVTTINFSKNENMEVEDKKLLKDMCNKEIERYNIFVSEGSKVASCCRLINDSELMEMASSVNSFGGTAMSMGSHRVVTINFNRIALEANGDYNKYMEILNDRINDAASILKAHKKLIFKMNDADLLPFVKMGYIDMKRMFSTIGIMGLVETKDKFSIDGDIIADSLEFLNTRVNEISKEGEIIMNIEQIPGESMCHRLPNADKLFYGEDSINYPIYANQFIPTWEDVPLWERMDEDGKYNQLITGGGIVHFNLGEDTTPKQNSKIIEYSVKSGCEHFALNVVYAICDNGHVHKGNIDVCPKCNSTKFQRYTRTVGFFTPVEHWSSPKREFDFKERVFRGV